MHCSCSGSRAVSRGLDVPEVVHTSLSHPAPECRGRPSGSRAALLRRDLLTWPLVHGRRSQNFPGRVSLRGQRYTIPVPCCLTPAIVSPFA